MAKSGDHSDLFMVFLDDRGKPLHGLSSTDMNSSDQISKQLLDGFTPGKVFEIDSFSMSAQSDDKSPAEIRSDIVKQNAKAAKTPPAKGQKPTPVMAPGDLTNEVNKQVAAQKGPPVKEITFKRSVDTSSQDFLTNVSIGKGYQRATKTTPKATGGKNDQQKEIAADVYLRIDFDLVLVTKVDWSDDDEEVTEDISFICRKITITYRPQLPDGTLGATLQGLWEWDPDAAQ
jgi:type VI protein secretion system component Hcp